MQTSKAKHLVQHVRTVRGGEVDKSVVCVVWSLEVHHVQLSDTALALPQQYKHICMYVYLYKYVCTRAKNIFLIANAAIHACTRSFHTLVNCLIKKC